MSDHPAKVGSQSLFKSEVIMIFVCHVISQDHAIKGPCDFMGGRP